MRSLRIAAESSLHSLQQEKATRSNGEDPLHPNNQIHSLIK